MSYPRPIIFADDDQLCAALTTLLRDGKVSMLSGMDNEGNAFAAFGWPDGEDVFCEAMMQHPYWPEPEWEGVRCDECGGLSRRFPLENLAFPVVVVMADEALIPEGGQGIPVVEQPPPPDEIETALEAGTEEEGS